MIIFHLSLIFWTATKWAMIPTKVGSSRGKMNGDTRWREIEKNGKVKKKNRQGKQQIEQIEWSGRKKKPRWKHAEQTGVRSRTKGRRKKKNSEMRSSIISERIHDRPLEGRRARRPRKKQCHGYRVLFRYLMIEVFGQEILWPASTARAGGTVFLFHLRQESQGHDLYGNKYVRQGMRFLVLTVLSGTGMECYSTPFPVSEYFYKGILVARVWVNISYRSCRSIGYG